MLPFDVRLVYPGEEALEGFERGVEEGWPLALLKHHVAKLENLRELLLVDRGGGGGVPHARSARAARRSRRRGRAGRQAPHSSVCSQGTPRMNLACVLCVDVRCVYSCAHLVEPFFEGLGLGGGHGVLHLENLLG